MTNEAAAHRAEADRLKAIRMHTLYKQIVLDEETSAISKHLNDLRTSGGTPAEVAKAEGIRQGIRDQMQATAKVLDALSIQIGEAESRYVATASLEMRAVAAGKVREALARMEKPARRIESLMAQIDEAKEVLAQEFAWQLWEVTPRGNDFGGRRIVEHVIAGGFARLLPALRITDPEENRREVASPHAPVPFSGQETFATLIGDALNAHVESIVAGDVLPNLSHLPPPSSEAA